MSSMAPAVTDKNTNFTRRLFNGTTARFSVLLLILMTLILARLVYPTSVNAQATSTTTKTTTSGPFSGFDECTGEIVSGVVQIKSTVHITTDANGISHALFHDEVQGKGVGETSGTKYVGPQIVHDSINDSSGGAMEETFTADFRFISQGGADNILLHVVSHMTITPDGNVTSEILKFTFDCRG